jgi:DNA-binding transcriptional ArsR family regulator/uncharacterized protein YndB with AHSA1/START domain
VDEDLVFKAMADPTRRHLLDLLFATDGQTLTDLESAFEMSRIGVMKHLRVLEEAGLVVSRKVGRKRFHHLNPVPIREIHDRWIDKYTHDRAAALADLKAALEAPMPERTAAPAVQTYQIFVRAEPERIWEAITTPAFTRRYFYESDITITPERILSHGPDGSVWMDDPVLEHDPPTRLVHIWTSRFMPGWEDEEPSRVTWTIEPQDGGVCKVTVVHDQLEGAPHTAANVEGAGWMFVLSGLKSVLETGEGLAS